MKKINVSLKVTAVLQVEIEADSLEDAIEKGNEFSWQTVLEESSVADGSYEVIGVSEDSKWSIPVVQKE